MDIYMNIMWKKINVLHWINACLANFCGGLIIRGLSAIEVWSMTIDETDLRTAHDTANGY